jgi:putative transposase
MVVTIKGKKYWLWRAVDGNGYVLDALLLQSGRNKAAALKLMRKLLKQQGPPRA